VEAHARALLRFGAEEFCGRRITVAVQVRGLLTSSAALHAASRYVVLCSAEGAASRAATTSWDAAATAAAGHFAFLSSKGALWSQSVRRSMSPVSVDGDADRQSAATSVGMACRTCSLTSPAARMAWRPSAAASIQGARRAALRARAAFAMTFILGASCKRSASAIAQASTELIASASCSASEKKIGEVTHTIGKVLNSLVPSLPLWLPHTHTGRVYTPWHRIALFVIRFGHPTA
jgi:hypothetical protein